VPQRNVPTPPILRTDRTVLRATTRSDLPALERTWTDPCVRKHLGGPIPDTQLASRRAAPIPPGSLTVCLHSGEPVGFCGLDRYETGDLELDVAFLPDSWGRGLAVESCTALIHWLTGHAETERRLVAWTQVADQPARRLLAALGMTETERFTRRERPQVLYALAW
jgi:RimJ/RimL family protein N-acetyltransferase